MWPRTPGSELEARVINSAVKDQIIADTMKPIQLARIRMAWKSATKVMEVADHQASGGGGKEDEPLPETVKQMLDQRWRSKYPGIVLDPALMPSCAIVHRLYREWVQGSNNQGPGSITIGDATLTVSDHGSTGVRLQYRSVSH